jgi:hypothetical protein
LSESSRPRRCIASQPPSVTAARHAATLGTGVSITATCVVGVLRTWSSEDTRSDGLAGPSHIPEMVVDDGKDSHALGEALLKFYVPRELARMIRYTNTIAMKRRRRVCLEIVGPAVPTHVSGQRSRPTDSRLAHQKGQVYESNNVLLKYPRGCSFCLLRTESQFYNASAS